MNDEYFIILCLEDTAAVDEPYPKEIEAERMKICTYYRELIKDNLDYSAAIRQARARWLGEYLQEKEDQAMVDYRANISRAVQLLESRKP